MKRYRAVETTLTEDGVWVEARWARLQRRLRSGFRIVFLVAALVVLTLHPVGRQWSAAAGGLAQSGWRVAAARFERTFGPDLILRQRAQRALRSLNQEQARLAALESESTRVVATIEGELPILLRRQAAVQRDLAALTAQIERSASSSVLTRDGAPQTEQSSVSVVVAAYTAVQEQVGRSQRALRLHRAALLQVRVLQEEAVRQGAALAATLTFFDLLWQERGEASTGVLLTASEEAVLRTALASQLDHYRTLRQARQDLAASLAAIDPLAEEEPLPPTQPADVAAAAP